MMTLGILEALRERNMKMPDDMAVIGFDDPLWACAFNPPLSVVRQPGYDIGREAADLLFGRIHDPNRSKMLVMLRHELIIRGSC